MTKRVMVTAGPVYGRIDDNKIVSNRARGIWAKHLARYLAEYHGYQSELVVPDIAAATISANLEFENGGRVKTLLHRGFEDYMDICCDRVQYVDAAVMAAAVLNYIPETTYKGKLPTDKERIELAFVLAPRVIDRMKQVRPGITLIGCKLLFSGEEEKLIDAAYKVVLNARCNMVVANDGIIGLRKKFLVHQDRAVTVVDNDFERLYEEIRAHIEDVHWSTEVRKEDRGRILKYSDQFNRVVLKYRDKFVRRQADKDFVFGAVAVRYKDPGVENEEEFLVSPREKGEAFDCWDAGVCTFDWDARKVKAWGKKVTLNAPLLARHLRMFPEATSVVHYHGDAPRKGEAPIVDYAPPGTARDNEREIPAYHYYIEGHGWIMALDENAEPLR